MVNTFPLTGIRAVPQIESKLKTWKKNYGSLASMLAKSGFGWNHSDHMITVDSDDIWENYVKVDPDAKSMRFKSWPYYEDWIEIFGRDRAMGENADGIQDAVNSINKDKEGEEDNDVEEIEEINTISERSPDDTALGSSKQVKDCNKQVKKDKPKKKGKSISEEHDTSLAKVVEALDKFTEKTKARLEKIVERLGYEHGMSLTRQKVYKALEPITWLSQKERMKAASHISSSDKNLDLFSSVPDNDKSIMVKMILDGSI